MVMKTNERKILNSRTLSFHGVDHFTGEFCSTLPIAKLNGNNGLGPYFDLRLIYSPDRLDGSFGNWAFSFNHAQVQIGANVIGEIFLDNGLTIKWDGKRNITLPNVFITRTSDLEITHINGTKEILKFYFNPEALGAPPGHFSYYLLHSITNAEGHSLYFSWVVSNATSGKPRLLKISDDATTLATIDYPAIASQSDIIVNIWPNSKDKYTCALETAPSTYTNINKILKKIKYNNFSTEISFEHLTDSSTSPPTPTPFLNKITYHSGLTETLTYQNGKILEHSITEDGTNLLKKSTYSYKGKNGNLITSVSDIDNRTTDYYFTHDHLPIKETLWVNGLLLQIIEVSRVEKKGQTVLTGTTGEPDPDGLELTTTTTYFNLDLTSRTEKAVMTFDTLGNITSQTENGVTTEWTYYPGVAVNEDVLVKIEKVNSPVNQVSLIGWAFDYGTPIGWGLQIFAKRGLTWGTQELRKNITKPLAVKHAKTAFNLPIELEYPGDPNHFKLHIESEKIYTITNGNKKVLKWTFYSYYGLQTKGNFVLGPTLKPSKKLTIFKPDIDAKGKLIKTIGTHKKIVLEENKYESSTSSPYHGRLLETRQSIYDHNGNKIKNSEILTKISYTLNNDQFTTTTSVIAEATVPITQSETFNILTGQLLKSVSSQGNIATYQYDAQGRVTSHDEHTSNAKLITSNQLAYSTSSNNEEEVTYKTPAAETVKNTFDKLDRLASSDRLHVDGVTWLRLQEYKYDNQDRIIKETELDYQPNGSLLTKRTRNMKYDHWDELSEISLEGTSNLQGFAYDPVNQQASTWLKDGNTFVSQTKQYIKKPGEDSRNEYYFYANGTLKKSQSFHYSDQGQLTKISSSDDAEENYTYDGFGRVSSATVNGIKTVNDYPDHIQATSASAAGIQSGSTVVNLGKQDIDRLGRVKSIVIGGETAKYTYIGASHWGKPDIQHAPVITQSQRITVSATWDKNKRELTETTTGGVTPGTASATTQTRSTYSLGGLLLETTDAFGNATRFTYDSNGYLTKTSGTSMTVDFNYSGLGKLESETLTDLTTQKTMITTYTYDTAGREIKREFICAGFQPLTIKTQYLNISKIEGMEMLQNNISIRKETFNYGLTGHLINYQCNGTHKPITPDGFRLVEQDFTSDMMGNLSSSMQKIEGATTTSFVDTYQYTGADPCQVQHIRRTPPIGNQTPTFQYDNLGHLTTDGSRSLSYNAAGQLAKLNTSTDNLEYFYDSLGRLTGCNESKYHDQFYYMEGHQYAREGAFNINGVTRYRTSIQMNQSTSCVLLKEHLAQGVGNTATVSHSFELKDIKGSVIASYDLSSNQVSFFSYTPFGYRPHTVDQRTWIGFNGLPIDSITKNYHLGDGIRVYNPATQLIEQPDPLSPFGEGGSVRYRYCRNDPINYRDPSGLWEIVNNYSVITSAPILEDRVASAILFGGIGIVMAPFTGGASAAWTLATVGLAAASAAFGIASAMLEKSNPQLAEALSWGSLTTGLASAGFGITGGMVAARAASAAAANATATKAVSSIASATRGGSRLQGIAKGKVQGVFQRTATKRLRYEVYSGGEDATLAQIESHGYPTDTRFILPAGPKFRFITPKEQRLNVGQLKMDHLLTGRDTNTLYLKTHDALRPGGTPDYWLTELTATDMVNHGLISATADVRQYYVDLATRFSVDIIRPLQQMKLSELMADLARQNYKIINGAFCRGPFFTRLARADIKNFRNQKIYIDWIAAGRPDKPLPYGLNIMG